MTTAQIYRGTENAEVPEIARDETLEKIIDHLNSFDLEKYFFKDESEQERFYKSTPILNPSQILLISRYMNKLPESHKKVKYLNNLIQKSYEAGNNDFILDCKDLSEELLSGILPRTNLIKELLFILGDTIGFRKHKDLLKMRILSDVRLISTMASFCNITAEQNVEIAGFEAYGCFVEIKGNLEYLARFGNSTYKIHGTLNEIEVYPKWVPIISSKTKLILNQEQYNYWKPKIEKNSKYKGITLEMIK